MSTSESIRFKMRLFASILLIGLTMGSCGSNSKTAQQDNELERLYSPISLYLNPLEYTEAFPCSNFYPLFANYPDDWAKAGLHNYPDKVVYQYHDSKWGQDFAVTGYFNMRGQIIGKINSVWGGDQYTYDDEGRLVEIRVFNSYQRQDKVAPPQYDGNRIAIWRQIQFKPTMPGYDGLKSLRFSYAPDSTLVEILPEVDDYVACSSKTVIGKMEFNEKGQLVRLQAPHTANPFLSDIDPINFSTKSESTYKYDDRGLCIEKTDYLIFTQKKDTVVSKNTYVYNADGDLRKWIYDGGAKSTKFANSFSVNNIKFEMEYTYEYDSKRNWITLSVMFPENYESNYVLDKYFQHLSQNSSAYTQDGRITVKIQRSIDDYYEKSYAEYQEDIKKAAEKEKEEEKKQRPKYSATQGRGLQGPVKMVKYETEATTLVFDKIGNLETDISENGYRDHNITYIYETPFRYSGDGERYTITCEGNVRIEMPDSDSSMPVEFEFDDKGRVIKYVYCEGMSPVTVKYFYSDKSILPVKSVESSYDELGEWETTREYKYIDVDKKGNWTRRSVSMTVKGIEYYAETGESVDQSSDAPSVYEEKRTISYY